MYYFHQYLFSINLICILYLYICINLINQHIKLNNLIIYLI